jgi:hypothetical protein
MNTMTILAEAATNHPDGTFSMLRGGITQVWGALPAVLRGDLLVRFEGDTSEAGSHEWMICVIDEDGKDIMPRMAGTFQVPQGGGNGMVVMKFGCQFTKYGEYSFRVTLDKQLASAWQVTVIEKLPGQAPK